MIEIIFRPGDLSELHHIAGCRTAQEARNFVAEEIQAYTERGRAVVALTTPSVPEAGDVFYGSRDSELLP